MKSYMSKWQDLHTWKHLLFWQPLLRDEKGEEVVSVRLWGSVVGPGGGKRRGQSAGCPGRSVYPLLQSTFCLLTLPLSCHFPTHLCRQLFDWSHLPVPHIFTSKLSKRQDCHLHNSPKTFKYIFFLLLFTIPFWCLTFLHLLLATLALFDYDWILFRDMVYSI